jgi:hypothetical protein
VAGAVVEPGERQEQAFDHVGGTTAPVLTTRRTDVALSALVEIVTVPPAML